MSVSNLTAIVFTMGRQGGTVHDVAKTLGVSVSDIINADDAGMDDLLRLAQQFRNQTGKFKRVNGKLPLIINAWWGMGDNGSWDLEPWPSLDSQPYIRIDQIPILEGHPWPNRVRNGYK